MKIYFLLVQERTGEWFLKAGIYFRMIGAWQDLLKDAPQSAFRGHAIGIGIERVK
ncbi:MAG: hypothetical protein JW913_05535 [Chitinispirillaceae bacterium]|nr:hypothetical protein [Chitinispirillaceae bacterium]